MLKMSEIENLDEKSILAKLGDLRRLSFEHNMQKAVSGIEKPHILREHKKDIARLNTVLTRVRKGDKKNGK